MITLDAYGLPPIAPQVEYFNSDTVVIGKVLSVVQFSPTSMKYQIQVEQYLKNPQDQNIITVIAEGTNMTLVEQGRVPDTVYDVGQQVFLYLKKGQDYYTAWYFSHSAESLCDPDPTKQDMNFSLSQDARFAALPAYSPLRVETGIPYLFRVDDTILMHYDAWNRHFTTKTFDVEFDVKNGTTGELISNVTKQVELKPCIGHQTVNATFIPKKAGTYEVDAIFDNSLLGTTVEVQHNVSGVKIESVPLSPLQQFKEGIEANDVHCWEGLQLVIKSEDNSPACVKLDAAYMLIKRGWAASESAYPGGDAQFVSDTNSTIMPAHLPRSSGLRVPYYESSRVINYSGFDGIYNETFSYRGTQEDYVLKPGSTGIITFKLDAVASEQQGQDYSIPIPKSINRTNYAVFYHEITSLEDLSKYPGVTFDDGSYGHFRACSTGPAGSGTCIGGPFEGKNPIEAFVTDHHGIDFLFEPPSEVLPLTMNTTSQIITMTITADSNAQRGTYLVELPSVGVDSFLLTVGDRPYHE